jgi:penicillin-binding protein 2
MNIRTVLPVARRGSTYSVATRIAVASLTGTVIFSILFLRLWALTVLGGDRYVELAERNQVRRIPVEAPRGTIVDRAGRPIVTNRPAREVVVTLRDVNKEDRPALYRHLASVLGVPVKTVRHRIALGDSNSLTPIVVARDVTRDEVIFYLEEHSKDFPGVRVRELFVRAYEDDRGAAAHMLGQVGEVSPDQLKHEFHALKPGDHVGQSGLEKTYDEYLRGTDGFRAIEVDAAGVPTGFGRGIPATPGNTLRLTIDLQLQRRARTALLEGIKLARSKGHAARAGALVAVDPRSGEVLALASFPTYDPNIFTKGTDERAIKAVLNDKRTPLSNRAIAGLYPPGSTYKPVTALAALGENFVTPDDLIPCPAAMKVAGTTFKNWYTESMGAIDMATALEVSCDTYFYKLGLDFYNTPGSRLQQWSADFGLGIATGIDLPGEADGTVPTPEWLKRTFDGWGSVWRPGDSVNLSIGQGNLLTTPLQMTSLYAAIANGGTWRQPRLASDVEDASGKVLVRPAAPGEHALPITRAQLKPVRDGLYRVVNGYNGTARSVFESLPVEVSGKTGTAEKPPHGDMAWFCGYAPAAAPTIAACAVVENGGHGGDSAAPAVRRVFEEYFNLKAGKITISGRSD